MSHKRHTVPGVSTATRGIVFVLLSRVMCSAPLMIPKERAGTCRRAWYRVYGDMWDYGTSAVRDAPQVCANVC